MFSSVDTKDPAAVEAVAQSIYAWAYPDADPGFVPRVFGWAKDCFHGRYAEYQPIDAQYHDLEHTLQGTLCMVRLLEGRFLEKVEPRLPRRFFELALLAILLHDTGYLKVKGDNEGTGAKYTLIHVQRSADFAARLLGENGYSPADAHAVQNMIRCTGLNADLGSIPFDDSIERELGSTLATADLLGQMAADDYVEKLPILFAEFAETAAHAGKMPGGGVFKDAQDLISKTPGFWRFYVTKKIATDFQGIYRRLERPPGSGNNDYIRRIEANISRIIPIPPG